MIKRIDVNRKDGRSYHFYKVDGEKADGVTTVISNALPKPSLKYWAPKVVAEWVADHLDEVAAMTGWDRDRIVNELKAKPWEQRDAAANRGTEIHALAERLVAGEEVDVPPELEGYVNSYVSFLDTWRPRPVLVEGVVASRTWMYAGTFDLVADIPNGERPIFDIKTGKGVYPDAALQQAAYVNAEYYLDAAGVEHPMAELGVTGAYIVHVRPDDYDVYPVDTGDDVFRVYQHLIWLSRRIGDHMKPWLGEPQEAPRV